MKPLVATFLAILLIGAQSKGKAVDTVLTDGENIGISIMGTITHDDVQDNVALIKELSSGRVLAVKKGYDLLKSYKVTEVRKKYIVIEKSDKSVYLVYQNKFASEFVAGSKKGQGAPAQSKSYREDGFERQNDEVTMTDEYRNKLVDTELQHVLMQATAIPAMKDGKIIGFQILQIDKGSIYEKAGFQDFDVVTSINGQKLNSVAGAVTLLKSLRSESKIQIDYLRGNSQQTLYLNVHH